MTFRRAALEGTLPGKTLIDKRHGSGSAVFGYDNSRISERSGGPCGRPRTV